MTPDLGKNIKICEGKCSLSRLIDTSNSALIGGGASAYSRLLETSEYVFVGGRIDIRQVVMLGLQLLAAYSYQKLTF